MKLQLGLFRKRSGYFSAGDFPVAVWVIHFLFVLAIGMLGCSRKSNPSPPDFTVRVRDSHGLGIGSSVQWRGLEVGRVVSVDVDNDSVRIDVRLHEPYVGRFREGLRAHPTRGVLGCGTAVLELYGGTDLSKPVLKPGAHISEATWTDTISAGQWKAAGLLILGIILLIVVLRLIRTLVSVTLAVIFLVFSGWFFYRQWMRHAADLTAVQTEMRWNELARQLLTDEASQEAWKMAQIELTESAFEFGTAGASHLVGEASALRTKMEHQAARLAAEGKNTAAEEIRKFVRQMENSERGTRGGQEEKDKDARD